MDELRDRALRYAQGQRTETLVPRVTITKDAALTGMTPGIYEPMLCLVLQGAKCAIIGDRRLHYDRASYFVASIEVPGACQIVEARPESPYLALALTLDIPTVAEIIIDMPGLPPIADGPGFGISPVTHELADAWLRLVKLFDTPADIPIMAPMLEREIIYRVLQGPHGPMIRQLARSDSRLGQVRRAISHIREHFDQSVTIETLSCIAGMSPSVFHKHFKDVTAMSPIQYQKKLRLHEARRRLLADPGDTARVAFSVGYESATQFSREYARQFGLSPARDAGRLRARNSESSELIDV
ncbi:AraC family transcriptional regulator [Rhizobium sp. P32RR-XVIII]|uniref:AraC family transcriptional regulator n=1 Tax=Rhizobium sp. P32RR-XVIII TaxID=2726738 RepID=UPI001FEF45DA|nr:AraC family transcriptional regulator [Rhizobium sp. P32RR-XVIII]